MHLPVEDESHNKKPIKMFCGQQLTIEIYKHTVHVIYTHN